MKLGAYIFPTEYTIGIVELARALEERGFESLWVTEHTHIPACRRSPCISNRSKRLLLGRSGSANADAIYIRTKHHHSLIYPNAVSNRFMTFSRAP